MWNSDFSYLVLALLCAWGGVAQAQGEPETLITLELAGGLHAGSHELSADDSYCLYGSSNGDDWRTLYGVSESSPGALSTVLLLIPATTPAEGGSSDFFLSAGFEEYGSDDYLEYILDPPNGNGSGTVTATWDGTKRAVLSISGQTAEGLSLSATITCANVLRVDGEALALSDLGELDFGTGLAAGAAAAGSLELRIGDETYTLQTGEEGACYQDLYEQTGNFQYSYYLEGYNGLDLFIPDFEAANGGTSDFGFAIDYSYLIYRTGEGSGTVTLRQDGEAFTLEVAVEMVDGTPVEATIRCSLAE